ncbi:PEP-CTERM putative exosortase interaction domain-containing protein [Opitutaceae bacterium TAV1]|nr:PEP-CTERM putative exosortase interaction domain-containing protein [Opitutaceae bacterium TAV1]
MKTNKLRLIGGLALASLLSASSTYAFDDLILGFRAPTGTTGATTNVTVNLGNFIPNFVSGHDSLTLLGNVNADLSNIYGSNWSERGDITFGAAGALELVGGTGLNPIATTWVGKANEAGATPDGWTGLSNRTVAQNLRNRVGNMHVGFNAGQDGTSPLVSLVESSLNGSYTWSTGLADDAFDIPGFSRDQYEQSASFSSGSLYQVIDLWQFVGYGAGNDPTYIGSLGLTADGDIYYSNNYANFAAVPEPATWAIIVGAAALGLVGYRRFRRHPLAGIA